MSQPVSLLWQILLPFASYTRQQRADIYRQLVNTVLSESVLFVCLGKQGTFS